MNRGFTRIDVAQRLERKRLSRVLQPMKLRWDKYTASEGGKNDVPD
jgi:hypothetical protein